MGVNGLELVQMVTTDPYYRTRIWGKEEKVYETLGEETCSRTSRSLEYDYPRSSYQVYVQGPVTGLFT